MNSKFVFEILAENKPLKQEVINVLPVLTPKIKIKAVLFDVYGTLFLSDTGDIGFSNNDKIQQAFQETFIKLGYDISEDASEKAAKKIPLLIEESLENSKRLGIEYPEVDIIDIFSKLIFILQNKSIFSKEAISREELEKIIFVFENERNQIYPMPYLLYIVKYLLSNNIHLGLISNAQFYTPYIFYYFMGGYPADVGFDDDLIFYSYKYGHAKPGHFLFDKARYYLEKKNINCWECIYVGNDMLNDIYPASCYGFKTCLFAGDKRSYRARDKCSECKELKSDYIINNLNQLSDIIEINGV